jgi:hypothetical protein
LHYKNSYKKNLRTKPRPETNKFYQYETH